MFNETTAPQIWRVFFWDTLHYSVLVLAWAYVNMYAYFYAVLV